MAAKLTQTEELKKFLNVVSGMTSEKGNPRRGSGCWCPLAPPIARWARPSHRQLAPRKIEFD
jgi:hypothetical protein